MSQTAAKLALQRVTDELDDYHKSKIECSRAMVAVGLGNWQYGGQWSSMNSWFRSPDNEFSITVAWNEVQELLDKITEIVLNE